MTRAPLAGHTYRHVRAVWLIVAVAYWLPLAVTLRAGAVSALTPSGASAGVSINITGTGFNTAAGSNEVTFSPASGASVTTLATTVTTVDAAKGVRRLAVKVPNGLPVGTAALRIVNTGTGEVTDGPAFSVIDGQLTSGASAARGASGVTVRVVGSANTQFAATNTRFTFGTGISIQSTTVESPTTATAVISVSTAAPLGVRSLTIVTTTQTLMLVDAFTVTDGTQTPTNQPPTVNAGTAQTITLPAGASLNGTASDDGLPTGSTLTTTWSKFSGPGTVAFVNANSLSTTATFDQAGAYVLRLTASDSLLSPFSDVSITVNPPAADQSAADGECGRGADDHAAGRRIAEWHGERRRAADRIDADDHLVEVQRSGNRGVRERQ